MTSHGLHSLAITCAPYAWKVLFICRWSDYILGLVTPANGPRKSNKLTWLMKVLAHNNMSTLWSLNEKQNTWLCRQKAVVCGAMCANYILLKSVDGLSLIHSLRITKSCPLCQSSAVTAESIQMICMMYICLGFFGVKSRNARSVA